MPIHKCNDDIILEAIKMQLRCLQHIILHKQHNLHDMFCKTYPLSKTNGYLCMYGVDESANLVCLLDNYTLNRMYIY